MAYLTMKQLLEAGVHFGHQTKRWNPKMKQYIFGARNGIYIIDLQQTVKMFKVGHDLVKDVASKGKRVLFVGTKKQAQSAIAQAAQKCGMDYVNHRWLGGLLTNFSTIKNGISRFKELEAVKASTGPTTSYTKKELTVLEKERARLERNIGGIRDMNGVPGVIFVVDSKKETIAIKEARRLGVPVVAIVDTNCDPDEVDYIIPGNDDAIRAIELFSNAMAEACIDGRAAYELSLQSAGDKAAPASTPSGAPAEQKAAATTAEVQSEAVPEAAKV